MTRDWARLRRGARRLGLALGVLAGASAVGAPARSGAPPLYPGLSRAALDYLVREAGARPPSELVAKLAALNSLRATDDFSAAAAHVEEAARRAGLPEVVRETFPADGRTWYGTFLSEPGWRVRRGRLCVLDEAAAAPRNCLVGVDYAAEPLGLAWYSRSADLSAEIVDVGEGTRPEDYVGRQVRGRVVLARGPHRIAHAEAVYERGAAGVLSPWSLFPEEFPDAHSSDGYGIRPWEKAGRPAGFLFAITPRQGRSIAEALRAGRALRARVEVDAEVVDARYEIVSARLAGSGTERELLLISHLDSTQPGACHNAAPAALLVEVGRLLKGLDGVVGPGPRAAVRLLWVPEHRGTLAWLLAHPAERARALGAINLDLLSDRQGLTGSVLQLRLSPDARPPYVGDVLASLLERAARDNTDDFDLYPARFRLPLVAEGGSRDSWRVAVAPFQGASDHVELLASGIPAVSMGSWRYPHLGTSGDTLEMFDPTHFRRLAFTVAAAAYQVARASESERREVGEDVLSRAQGRLAARAAAASAEVTRASAGDLVTAAAAARRAVQATARRETETVRSAFWLSSPPPETMAALERSTAEARRRLDWAMESRAAELGREAPRSRDAPGDPRVPTLDPGWLGPVTADYLRHRLGSGADGAGLAFLTRHGDAAFEALNFVDGRLNLGEIADRVEAEFPEATGSAAWFALLERAGIVNLAPARVVAPRP